MIALCQFPHKYCTQAEAQNLGTLTYDDSLASMPEVRKLSGIIKSHMMLRLAGFEKRMPRVTTRGRPANECPN
jgi:hypothetical protein